MADENDLLIQLFQVTSNEILSELYNANDLFKDKQRRRMIELMISRLDELGATVRDILPKEIADEYADGAEMANNQLMNIGLDGAMLATQFNSRIHLEAVQSILMRTGEDLQASIRTAQISGISGIQAINKKAQVKMAKGLTRGVARKQSTQEIKAHFAENGLTSFITRDGRRLPLDFYAKTVVRTERKKANVEGQLNRYKENNVQYVRVNSHSPTCHICAKYHNVIVQISGEKQKGIPHIQDTDLPPYHPNCRCSITPVSSLEGEHIKQPANNDPRTDAQKRAYNAEQGIRRKANAERKEYERLKASGVDDVPKTIGAYRRMKRKNDDEWKRLQRQYANSVQTASSQNRINSSISPMRRTADQDIINEFRNNTKTVRTNNDFAERKINERLTELGERRIFVSSKDVMENGNPYIEINMHGERTLLTPNEENRLLEKGLKSLRGSKEIKDFVGEHYTDLSYDGRLLLQKLKIKTEHLEDTFDVKGFDTAFGTEYAKEVGGRGTRLNRIPDENGNLLTDRERRSLKDYTGISYKKLNGWARNQTPKSDIPEFYLREFEDIDRILNDSELTEDLYLQRGAGTSGIGEENYLKGMADPKSIIGQKHIDLGYASTSINAEARFDKKVIYHMLAPQGTKGLYIREYSEIKNEDEILLPRGTIMNVLDAKVKGRQLHLLVGVEQSGE